MQRRREQRNIRELRRELEPETQAILKLCEEWPMGCCVAYHSAGSVIYWDYGSTGAV